MKPLISFALIFSFLFIICMPVYASAKKDFERRAADINKTYGIIVTYDDMGKHQASNQLTQIESALSYLGAVFTKSLAKYYSKETLDGDLRIVITADENWENLSVAGTFSVLNNTIELYVRANSVVPVANIIHEFGHAYHRTLSKDEYDEFCDINGGKEEYVAVSTISLSKRKMFDSERYVSKFAETRESEDFAETFTTMILKAGDEPNTVSKDTILYRKFVWIRNNLVEHVGTKSYATKRASDFLAISIED